MKHFFITFYTLFVLLSFSISGYADTIFKETWQNIQTAAEHAKYGKSQWQNLPTGQIRLISCRTGIKDLTKLMLGIEVMMTPGWILEDYSFNVVTDSSYTSAIFPVFRTDTPVNGDWTHGYTPHVIFPVQLQNLPQKDIKPIVEYKLKMKNSETGFFYDVEDTLSLTLSANESYQSDTCAALNRSLHTAAFPMDNTQIKVNNQLLDTGDVKIQIVFPKAVSIVDIQGRDGYSVQVQNALVEGRIYTAVIKADHPLEQDEEIPLNFRTSNGFYTATIKVSPSPLPTFAQPISLWVAFWTGLLFFFLSPIWSIWFTPQSLSKTTRNFKKQVRKVQISCLLGIAGLGGLWQLGMAPTNWMSYPIMIIFAIFVLGFLIWKPIPSVVGLGVLICFLPKPFWENVAFVSGGAKIGLLVWWAVCCCLPLNGWLLGSKSVLKFFKQTEKSQDRGYYHIIRLPYWILIWWLIISGGGYFLFENDPDITHEKSPETPAFVRVTSPDCLTCLHEKTANMAHKLASDIKLYRASSTSDWAKMQREKNKIQAKNFNVLITKNGQEIIIPVGLSLKKTKDILRKNINP